ncbi:hypothetical protein L1049_010848 [Liquidambar formosana]|uniref:Uncharacterized protein n=1 Tax=Liquidambar formosana TaxID=63359 RepID=A0AAP0RQ59_LIQFO
MIHNFSTAQLDKDCEIFQNRHEDKEQSDFIDYGWANIGSFDDLDRIFSNDDPIFGHVSLDNADELWSSSKDVSNSPVKSFPLSADSPSLGFGVSKNASEHFEIKKEYVQDEDHSLPPGHGKTSDPASHGLQKVHAITDQATLDAVEKTATSNSPTAAENLLTLNKFAHKVNKQKRALKFQEKVR